MTLLATISRALAIATTRLDYCVLDTDEQAHLVACMNAGMFDRDGRDFAFCVLEDAQEDIGLDADIALSSLAAIPV